jgi:hypothetical protein
MAIKDFDAKQFMLEKGERVGLGVALFLMVLLIIVSLFMPARGFFSGSPKEKAAVLEKSAASVQSQLRSSLPSDADKPGDPKVTMTAVKEFNPITGQDYTTAFAGLFAPTQLGPQKRHQPDVLPIKLGNAVVTHNQIDAIMMRVQNDGKIMVYLLDDADARGARGGGGLPGLFGSGRGGGKMPPGMPGAGRGQGMGGSSGAGRFMGGGSGGMAPGGLAGLGGMEGKKDMKLRAVPLDKLREESNPHYAEQVLPLRAAIVAAAFPYGAQLEEFRDKLRLSSTGQVLGEFSGETDADGNNLPAFRFLGVDVERAEVGPDGKLLSSRGPDGKPVTWYPVPLKEAYTPYLIATAKRFEADDPKYAPLTFPGLVMPRLKLFRDGKDEAGGEGDKKETHNEYPKVEDSLKPIHDTLDELAKRDPNTIPKPPSQFTVEGSFDVFQPASESAQGPGGPGSPGMPGGPGMPPMPGRGGTGKMQGTGRMGGMMPPGFSGAGKMQGMGRGGMMMPPGAGRGAGAPAMPGMPGMGTEMEGAPPEYCLVRVIDPTVQPGHVYQYRLRVRMANPNYGHAKEVAAVTYAQKKELDPGEWYVVPKTVSVPPEMHYYAVDEKELEGANKYKGLNRDAYLSKDRTAMQIHRWLEAFTTRTDRKNPLPVGEWVVAERVIAYRGEYVGADQRIEFPYWRATQEQFVLSTEPGATKRVPGVMVSFKPDWGEGLDTVLVDFQGGNEEYKKVSGRDEDGKPNNFKNVRDAHGTEILLLSPDGKLLFRDEAEDAKDGERTERLKEVKDRIKEVKDGGNGGGGNQPGGPGKSGGRNPFGGRDS